jgi:hypothetical protein
VAKGECLCHRHSQSICWPAREHFIGITRADSDRGKLDPDNLAEGCAKNSRRALASYADSAYSSAKEVANHLIKSRDLEILPTQEFQELFEQGDEVSRLCFSLTIVPPNAK